MELRPSSCRVRSRVGVSQFTIGTLGKPLSGHDGPPGCTGREPGRSTRRVKDSRLAATSEEPCQTRPPGHPGPGGQTATSIKGSDQPVHPSIVKSPLEPTLRTTPPPEPLTATGHSKSKHLRGRRDVGSDGRGPVPNTLLLQVKRRRFARPVRGRAAGRRRTSCARPSRASH